MVKRLISRQVAILLFLLSSTCFLKAQDFQQLDPIAHEGYEVKENKIYFRIGNAGLILEAATPESIAQYYTDRGAKMMGDPFPSLVPELQNSTIFILTLINRTHGSFTFSPNYAALHDQTEAFFPLDVALLLPTLDAIDQHTKRILEASLFGISETVPAGKTVTKFLIYTALPKKSKTFELEFSNLFLGTTEVRQLFYFQRANK